MARKKKNNRYKLLQKLNKIIFLIFSIIIITFISILSYRVYYFSDMVVVKKIEVQGASRFVEERILQDFQYLKYKRINQINLQEIDDLISEYPWVQNAAVFRNYNGLFTIIIKEKVPYFIWLDDNNNYNVLGADKKPIDQKLDFSLDRIIALEKGQEALDLSDEIRFVIYKDKNILSKIKKIELKDFMWLVHLDDGVLIKLPIDNLIKAYTKLVETNRKYNYLDKNIEYVDVTSVNIVFVKPK